MGNQKYAENTKFYENLLLAYIPENLQNLLIEVGAYISGGAIIWLVDNDKMSRYPLNDFDVYFREKEHIEMVTKKMDYEYSYNTFYKVFSSNNASTYHYYLGERASTGNRYQIQLIKGFIGEPEDVVSKFDFDVCTGYFDFKDMKLHITKEVLGKIKTRQLKYNVESYNPVASIYRLKKFQRRGFYIEDIDILTLLLRINSLDIKTFLDLIPLVSSASEDTLMDLRNDLLSYSNIEGKYSFEEFLRWKKMRDTLTKKKSLNTIGRSL